MVNAAAANGIKVVIDPHNGGRWVVGGIGGTAYPIGSPTVPITALADFWGKMAAHFKGNSAIYAYGLMNEPYLLGNDTKTNPNTSSGEQVWFNCSQACINSIRAVDPNTTIDIPGYYWSDAACWKHSDTLKNLADPSNKLIYEAHCYLDSMIPRQIILIAPWTRRPNIPMLPSRLPSARNGSSRLWTGSERMVRKVISVKSEYRRKDIWVTRFKTTLDYITLNQTS